MTRIFRALFMPLALVASVGLAACSPGDVQLEGKVFEALGANELGKKRAAANLKSRTPLVMPPATGALPEPGSGQEQQIVGVEDQDQRKIVDKAALEKKHKEFCEKHYDQTKQIEGEIVNGPLGDCRKSILDHVSIEGLGF